MKHTVALTNREKPEKTMNEFNQSKESGEYSGWDQSGESGENSGCDQLREKNSSIHCNSHDKHEDNCSELTESKESNELQLEYSVLPQSSLYKVLSVINNSKCNHIFSYKRLKVKEVDWDKLFAYSKVLCWKLIQFYNTSLQNETNEVFFKVVFKIQLFVSSSSLFVNFIPEIPDFKLTLGFNSQNETFTNVSLPFIDNNIEMVMFCGTLPFVTALPTLLALT